MLAAGQDQGGGAIQAGGRFAQHAAGVNVVMAKGIGGVYEDQIDIAGEAAVLEAIIEEKNVRLWVGFYNE